MWRTALLSLIFSTASLAAPKKIVDFRTAARHTLVSQGIPVAPMPTDDVTRLTIVDSGGRTVPALVEPESRDPLGRVRWVRVSLVPDGANPAYALVLNDSPSTPARLDVEATDGVITVRQGDVVTKFTGKDQMEIRKGSTVLLSGPVSFQLFPDARSIINAGGKTTVLAPFEPSGFTLEQPSPGRVVVTLRGRNPKQKAYNFQPGNNEPKLGFDVEAQFEFTAVSPMIRYQWRLINRAGYKSWLERFAMVLPILGSGSLDVTAPWAKDFGGGMGTRRTEAGLLIGGINPPPDEGFGGKTPGIHRLFYHGMARTFSGDLVPGQPRSDAVSAPLIIAAQYYSDLGVLPERGLPVNAGEFSRAVAPASSWLLDWQWRGTLWAGEWWREWDLVRDQGSEEASNGNSGLAPFYHFLRTGDARFLDSASLAAGYVFDIQQDHKQTGFGPVMHTRRHMLDELDWIHPRYQRAFGPILISHLLLAGRQRQELIATLRHFVEQIQSDDGTPYNWDEAGSRRAASETGVDTANIIEALVTAWEETGDVFFLDRARGYSRWLLKNWRSRKDDTFWNWNLTRYVLTGMLAICRVGKEYPGKVPEIEDFFKGTAELERHTVSHPELTSVPGTIGGGDLHYVFYHAWLGTEYARLTGDSSLLPQLAKVVRREVAKQQPDGTFPMDLGTLWSQYPTKVISYYDAKSVVAYLPVLGARLAMDAVHR